MKNSTRITLKRGSILKQHYRTQSHQPKPSAQPDDVSHKNTSRSNGNTVTVGETARSNSISPQTQVISTRKQPEFRCRQMKPSRAITNGSQLLKLPQKHNLQPQSAPQQPNSDAKTGQNHKTELNCDTQHDSQPEKVTKRHVLNYFEKPKISGLLKAKFKQTGVQTQSDTWNVYWREIQRKISNINISERSNESVINPSDYFA